MGGVGVFVLGACRVAVVVGGALWVTCVCGGLLGPEALWSWGRVWEDGGRRMCVDWGVPAVGVGS
ncbi:hypothetical protein GCM10022214_42240 [Actinomadura miaoliensis]|uniref:Uncharacterized protein n=1 Tax=Actinomadura miaoliensis TaxID=430685 RepID=A0ABP7W339_9ACTN